MRKEYVIELATGKIAYPDAHTTKGRLAYIDLYRSMGYSEWKKRFLHIYIGDGLITSSKEQIVKFGFWAEHCKLMNEVYNKRIEGIKKEIEQYESERQLVKYSEHLISDEIESLENQIAEVKRLKARMKK